MRSDLQAQLRTRDWYLHKLIPFATAINVGLALGAGRRARPLLMELCRPLVLLSLFVTLACLGYYLNNLADAAQDRLVGKPNASWTLAPAQRRRLLAALVALSVGEMAALSWMGGTGLIWILYVAHLVASVCYSVAPMRLKARGAWGVVTAVLAQYVCAICFVIVYYEFPPVHAAALVVCFFLSGLCIEVGHQRWDRERDRAAGCATFAVRASRHRVDALYRRLLAADRLCLWAVTGTYGLLFVTRVADRLGAVLFLFPIVFLGKTSIKFRRLLRSEPSFPDPYYRSQGNIADTYHTYYPNFLLPLTLCLAVAVLRPPLIPVELLMVVLVLGGHGWRSIGWHARLWRWVLMGREHP